ncbi:hypothetical protein BCR42DRAFT_398810 [Absidia repens]|uniref:Insertion element IS150 protein InsJ-like helix-turn-helix domain-containing protein n=1 Tax=Absidia repens TaxID=90262 RepID=A0A1X2HWV3_9FUNG|nr:hypothetical protein BCR42DRAFT_398810 [Absidia repens]
MTLYFYYEDGQGNVVDENGNEAMEIFLTNMKTYLGCQTGKDEQLGGMEFDEDLQQQEQQQDQQKKQQKKAKTYTMYSEEINVLVITYYLDKLVSAAKVGRKYNVDERTAQRWIKEYKHEQAREGTEVTEKKKPRPKNTLNDEHEH